MVEIEGTHILAVGPQGASAPDSVALGDGSTWIEYGNGVDSTGKGGPSTIVRYGSQGQVQQTYTIPGSVDGLKYDPITGDIWALSNQDGNSQLRLIDPRTNQVSAPMNYAVADGARGYDDVVFDGSKVFLSYTNPANPGDPVLQELVNGTAPFGTLHTTNLLSFGDTGTNLVTGQTNQALPLTDPDSLKLLPDGSLILTGGSDDALTIIDHPGTAQQTASFIQLPAGFSPDDALMPTSGSGVFTIANGNANTVLQVRVSGLNTHDIYADITSKNELVQIDPHTGKITTVLAGLASPHGLAFTADPAAPVSHDVHAAIAAAIDSVAPNLAADLSTFLSHHGGSVSLHQVASYAGSVAYGLDTASLQSQVALQLSHHA